MSYGLLIDTTRCIGCGACSAACKEQNDLPLPIEEELTAYTWTTVRRAPGPEPGSEAGTDPTPWVRSLCMHCLDPTCVSVCPVGALSRLDDGPVVYDGEKCIGCRYCIMACPFQVPKYQWDRPLPVVGKCILCAGRVADEQPTACAAVCPTGATLFGERDDLLNEARARIGSDPSGYVDHIYGLTEAGGTSVLLLSSVPFERLGLRTDLPLRPLPLLTWNVLSKVPDFVMIAGTLLFGIHWITSRREYVRDHEAGNGDDADPAAGPASPGRGQR